MKNWKTNLGGAISILATSLLGIGLVPGLVDLPAQTLKYIALAGFLLSAIGKGVTALFAADASVVNNVAASVDKINAEGPSPFAPKAVEKPTETKP